jgi:predicted kinase
MRKETVRIRPALVIIAGVPGSGKTMLAHELCKQITDAAYISKDILQDPFTKHERVMGREYSKIRAPTFRILLDFAEIQLSLGKIPVIDAPFSINHWRNDYYSDWADDFKRVTKRHGARLAIIRCQLKSDRELKQRLIARNLSRDNWKLVHWNKFLQMEPLDFPILHDDIFDVMTDRPVRVVARDVLDNFLTLDVHKNRPPYGISLKNRKAKF